MSDLGSGGPTTPAATTGAPPGGVARPAGTAAGGDWTVVVTNQIESVVGTVRDKTTVPVTKVARGVVYGLIVATLGVVALVLIIIMGVRFLNSYIPIEPYGRRVWVTYAALGAIFVLAGVFSWTRRAPRRSAVGGPNE